ncbi:MAG: glycosyltransferase family 4 protein [Gemmatimonadaceae bacterium]|nr:glycosyltransferase family 4 protein [Gemmatimonadaceae bacterium]
MQVASEPISGRNRCEKRDCAPTRPRVAFFDYPDVFEDFYPHYGVDQRAFGTRWAETGVHAVVTMVQRDVGDVTWYSQSLKPEIQETVHAVVGCRVKMLPSSWLHRLMWRAFYLSPGAWRWRWRTRAYGAFATVASYASPASVPLLSALRHDRPDVLFTGSYMSGRFDVLVVLAKLLGIPLIAFHSGGEPHEYLGKMTRRWTIPRADMFIVSSQAEGAMLMTRYAVPAERVALILTPIDTTGFRPTNRVSACRLADLDPARRYLLFVGRLVDEVKRVSALIRAFAPLMVRHPDADLLIVGEGPDGERLRQLGAELAPGRVRFLGWRSGIEVLTALYNAAECLLLPSRREGFPTVVGEAMACGTPVLASQVGGVAELVVEGETGWLVPAGDDNALASRLSFVLDHRDAVAAMRPRARSMAETRVSREMVAQALAQCFASVLERAAVR